MIVPGDTAQIYGDISPQDLPDGKVSISDAVVALEMAEGLLAGDFNFADVAPLRQGPEGGNAVDGGSYVIPEPDGLITTEDVIVLLEASIGLIQLPFSKPESVPSPPVEDTGLPPLNVGKFVDVTLDVGLNYTQHSLNDPLQPIVTPDPYMAERMSGGAAVGDVDGDGYIDLYVTVLDDHDLLFRNKGDGTFEDITVNAGLDIFNLQSNDAAFGDIDNDGDLDLYVTVIGDVGDAINNRNYLFINDGTGVFSESALARNAGVVSTTDNRRLFGIALGDYDKDGYLDIHTNEWVKKGSTARFSSLLRNLGGVSPGVFEEATMTAGVDLTASSAFGSTFTDLDGDGWPDLAVVADFGTSRLFRNQGDGSFEERTVSAGVGTDLNGMGSTLIRS